MIETINIWKRSNDGQYSVCILVKNATQEDAFKGETFRRFTYRFENFIELQSRLNHYINAILQEL